MNSRLRSIYCIVIRSETFSRCTHNSTQIKLTVEFFSRVKLEGFVYGIIAIPFRVLKEMFGLNLIRSHLIFENIFKSFLVAKNQSLTPRALN